MSGPTDLLLKIALVLLFVFIGISVALGLVIHFPYRDQLDHRVSAACLVVDCSVDKLCSCGKSVSCICFHFAYSLELASDEKNYTKNAYTQSRNLRVCDDLIHSQVACYYDNRSIQESLSTQDNYEAMPAIIFLSVLECGSFVLMCVTLGQAFLWKWRGYYEEVGVDDNELNNVIAGSVAAM